MSCQRCSGTNTSPQTHAGDGRGFHYSALRRVVPDEKFDFGGGLENSPFEANRYLIGVVFMVTIFFCVFL